jgi:hypothetical protein
MADRDCDGKITKTELIAIFKYVMAKNSKN